MEEVARPIEEIWKDLSETKEGDVQRVRQLHKELVKGYGREQGISFMFRYPLFPYYFAGVASLVVLIVTVFTIFVS